METTNTNPTPETPTSNFPDSPAELIQNNTTVTPEEVWERYITLDPTDQQTFILNCVAQMMRFHKFVIKEKMENGDDDNTLPLWIKDGAFYNIVRDILLKVSD